MLVTLEDKYQKDQVPLKYGDPAEDALVLDSTSMTIDEVVEKALQYIESKLAE